MLTALDIRTVFVRARRADPGSRGRRVMSTLPGRPSLDQLRRQARELHRAAADGDEDSVRRVRAVSPRFTLSAAQLAIAREYGFASWPKLRAEVARRRAAADDPAPDPSASSPKSWQEM